MRSTIQLAIVGLFALTHCAHLSHEIKSCQPGSSYESAWRTQKPIQISRQAFIGTRVGFDAHPGYLAMNLPYQFIQPVFFEVQEREKLKLITRGESHVTVITPPEESILKAQGVPPQLIDARAQREKIQNSKLNPVCLGEGSALVGGVMEKTYYIVLEADRLRQLRLQFSALVAKDETSRLRQFEPGRYLPHLTVGFTRQDLFEQNGVVKDATSCIYPLELIP